MSWRGATAVGWLTLCGSLAAAADADYAVSMRTELRVRSSYPDDRWSPVAADVAMLPDLMGDLRWTSTRISLQYNPSLLLRDRVEASPFILLNRGRFTLVSTVGHTILTFSEEAAYGDADVSVLGQTDATGSTATLLVATLPYRRSSTTASVDSQLSDRVGVTFLASYLVSGSPGNDQLPLQWGPSATARARLTLDRLDSLTTTVTGSAARFAPLSGRVRGQELYLGQVTETWDRQLSRTLSASLGGGVALTREYIPPRVDAEGTIVAPAIGDPIPGEYAEVLPVVTAGLSWREEAHTLLTLTARMAPFADRFTGLVYERVEARAQAELRPLRPLTATAAAWAAIGVPLGQDQQSGDQVYAAEATVSW